MEKNIDQLTQKIYEEGIGKANKEAESLIDEATNKSEEVIQEARKTADKIVSEAKKEADKLYQNSISEIKLAGQQAVGALKQQIQNLLSEKIIENNVEGAFDDVDFLKKLILEITEEWKSDAGIDISISSSLQDKIDTAFEKSLVKNIKNFEINFDHKLKSGFKISQEGKTFQLVFSDEDFIEFFKPFLREKSREILFD